MEKDIKILVQEIISNQNLDDREIFFQLKRLVANCELLYSSAKDSTDMAKLVAMNIEKLQIDTPHENVIKTGFTDFDRIFGGFTLGEFVVIGARPAMGKTQLLINLALYISQTTPVFYYSIDLSEDLLSSRIISSLTGIASSKILKNNLSDEKQLKLKTAVSVFGKRTLFVNDSCNITINAFKEECRKQIEKNSIKVIIVDYLQLMTSYKHRNNRDLEISFLCRELKNIAKEFNVCVIVSSQLSRAVETRGGAKQPMLSDLRESGAIEQDADKVIFIYRPEYYHIFEDAYNNNTKGLVELIIAKNRNGWLGSVNLLIDKDFTKFTDYDKSNNDFTFDQNRLDEIDNPF